MAASKIVAANMALALVGSKTIVSIDEASQEGKVCNLHIDHVLDEVLRDYPWPRCTKTATLALVAEDPTTEWAYSYRLPSDCVMPQRIVSALGLSEKKADRVPYEIHGDSSGGLLLTNWDEVVLQYTWRNENWEHFPIDMVRAIAAKLAFYIAPRLTEGDPFQLQNRALEIYRMTLGDAAANSGNEVNAYNSADTETIAARDN